MKGKTLIMINMDQVAHLPKQLAGNKKNTSHFKVQTKSNSGTTQQKLF